MAASSLSGPTVFSTSAWAMAAARAIRRATDRTCRRCSARSCGSTWTAPSLRGSNTRSQRTILSLRPAGLPEIWAYGLRNPWRFSFDRATGKLFAGDVGQNSFEEVDIITRAGNFGWNKMEASHCYPPGSVCSTAGLTLPIMEYAHNASGGEAIICAFVYRGSAIVGLAGAYVFGDLSSGHIWAGVQDSSGNWSQTLVLNHNLTVSSFGQDSAGELYLLDYGNGAVLHLRAAP